MYKVNHLVWNTNTQRNDWVTINSFDTKNEAEAYVEKNFIVGETYNVTLGKEVVSYYI